MPEGQSWSSTDKKDDCNNLEIKLLFENLPGILIWDFFSSNFINDLKQNKLDPNQFKLNSTGLDDVIWTYQLIKNY